MRRNTVIFELTDKEIRTFCIEFSPNGKYKSGHTAVKFDRIQVPPGIIEQGNIRNQEVILDLLDRYHTQLCGSCHEGYLAIPQQQGFVREYKLPWLPKRDRKSALSLFVTEEVPIPGSDLIYDYRVLSEERSKNLHIILGAFRQSVLKQYVDIFELSGFKIIGVDFSFHVLGQALELDEREDTLFLQAGTDNLQMVLFSGSVPDRVRTLSDWASKELNEGHDITCKKLCQDEIRSFLLYYKAQKANHSLYQAVWCGNSNVEEIALSLEGTTMITLIQRAKFDNVPNSWQTILNQNEGFSEVVIGYGLCLLSNRQQLNLWRQPTEEKIKSRRYSKMAFIALILVLFGILSWFYLVHRQLSEEREVQVLAQKGAILVEQVKHEEELNNSWNKVKDDSNKVGVYLEQILSLSKPELVIEQMQYKQGILTIRGNSTNSKSVQTLIQSISELGWEKPDLLSYQSDALSQFKFSLSTKLKTLMTSTQNTTAK